MIEPSFQGANRLFVLAFENDDQRISGKRYYIPNVEIMDYNVMIDGKNFFDQPVKNDKVTYDNIKKIATGQGLLQKFLQNNCNRFKQTTSARCWS